MISMSRRNVVVSGAVASAVFGVGRHVEIIRSAAAAPAEQRFHKFKLGDAEIITVFDGPWNKAHDPGFIKNATVDETKAALRAAGLPDDHLPLSFTVTFLKRGDTLVMFDAGTGGQLAPTAGKLTENMKAAGIDPAAITSIVVTHFHPDHIFGLMTKDTNAPVYSGVEIVVPSAEFKFWTDESVFGKIPQQNHGLAKRIQETLGKWKNVRRIEGGEEVAPGVTAISAFGHTPGHTLYAIGSGEGEVLNLADTSNLPALFARHPEWHAAFDMDAGMAEANRRKFFDRAVAGRAIVSAYHFGMPGIGRMEKDGAGYAFVPLTA